MSLSLISPLLFVILLLFIGLYIASSAVKILREYERAVVFTLGRFTRVRGPGLVLMIPLVQQMVRVDLRIQVIEIPSQDVISRDNVSMKVDAVLYFKVVNPERAIIQVQSYLPATNMLAQTTMRAVLGQHELDEMLSERKKLSEDVQSILDAQTETWGIKVSNVEIRTVELTENMVRAIAKQAEAERDRRAKIIHAEAEFQASQTLVNAAKILSTTPAAMQLRYLQTLRDLQRPQRNDAEGHARRYRLRRMVGIKVFDFKPQRGRDCFAAVSRAEDRIVLQHRATDARLIARRRLEANRDGADIECERYALSTPQRGMVPVQPARRPKRRMTGERKLLLCSEDAHADPRRLVFGRKHEGSFGKVGLARQRLHPFRRKRTRVVEDGQGVAGQRVFSEDVDNRIGE